MKEKKGTSFFLTLICIVSIFLFLKEIYVFNVQGMENVQEMTTDSSEHIQSDEIYLVNYHNEAGVSFYDVVCKDNIRKNPLILFFPGFNSTKESVYDQAKLLAMAGYTVVVPDLIGQHESVREDVMTMFDIIYNTSDICDDLLLFYEDSEIADTKRFGMVGMSMGGMIALHFAAFSNIRPACVATMYSTPDFSSVFGGEVGYIQIINGETSEIENEYLKKKYIASMIQFSPDQNMEYMLQIPILLINGDIDPLIPVSAIREFLVKKDFYPNNLISIIRENRGHETCAEDPVDVIKFVYQYLPTDSENMFIQTLLGEQE